MNCSRLEDVRVVSTVFLLICSSAILFVLLPCMKNRNVAIAWNWEHDKDFINALVSECERRDLSTILIDPANLQGILNDLNSGHLTVDVLYDRASDSDLKFVPLVNLLQNYPTRLFNGYPIAERARDKTTMHLEFMSAGLYVPHSLLLPPYQNQPVPFITEGETHWLGIPFVIKPANTTGGGSGVHLNASTLTDIFLARQEYPKDKYLIQETITPALLEGRRAWFRILYAFGEVLPFWGDDHTHVYRELALEEETLHELSTLRNYVHTIQGVCKLDFFSTEIAVTKERKFVVVDYVNEVCDMRLQSKCVDGVPDATVSRIISLLVNEVEITLHRSQVTD